MPTRSSFTFLVQPQTRKANCAQESFNIKCPFLEAAVRAIESKASGRKRRNVFISETKIPRTTQLPRTTRMFRTTRVSRTTPLMIRTTRMSRTTATTKGSGTTDVTPTNVTDVTPTNATNVTPTNVINVTPTNVTDVTPTDDTGGTGGVTRPPTDQERLNRFCEYRDRGQFAFPVNCQAFVHCDANGRATFDACAPGQHFHQETRGCVPASSFSCYDGFIGEPDSETSKIMLFIILLL